jgi:hypothetical protein
LIFLYFLQISDFFWNFHFFRKKHIFQFFSKIGFFTIFAQLLQNCKSTFFVKLKISLLKNIFKHEWCVIFKNYNFEFSILIFIFDTSLKLFFVNTVCYSHLWTFQWSRRSLPFAQSLHVLCAQSIST